MFGERLKACRTKANLTMKTLGDKVGLAESTISLYEAEKRAPDPDTIKRFADTFGVSTDYLLGRTNEKSPDNESELDIDTLEYALYGEARELDEDEKKQLLELAKFMRKKRQEQDENK